MAVYDPSGSEINYVLKSSSESRIFLQNSWGIQCIEFSVFNKTLKAFLARIIWNKLLWGVTWYIFTETHRVWSITLAKIYNQQINIYILYTCTSCTCFRRYWGFNVLVIVIINILNFHQNHRSREIPLIFTFIVSCRGSMYQIPEYQSTTTWVREWRLILGPWM